jgi:hypothetical protein
MIDKISVKVDASIEQIKHMKQLIKDKSKLHNDKGHLLPYSKLGKYLIDNFGEQISNAIIKQQDNG